MSDLKLMAGTPGVTWTRPFVYTAGHYNFAGQLIPYYSATMTVTEALRDLVLAHQLPVNADDPVRLDELMQRVLDDERAGADIVDYLRRPGRIKFFNSLTVVLLPTSTDGRPQDEFGPPLEAPSSFDLEDDSYIVRRAGGVIIRELKGGGVGHMLWQPDTVRAVIIDGQHRFAAMRNLHGRAPQILEADQSRIPVLIVAPTEELGFRAPGGAPKSIIATSRSIFTDINKNAKRVGSERQYLLDDVSFSAVAMRRVLTDGIGGSFSSAAHSNPSRIPLASIDWTRSERSRFDDLEWPAISTVRALHQLVVQSMEKVPGEQDWNRWRTWINWVDDELAPSAPWIRRNLIERLSGAEDREDAFVLTSDEFEAAVAAFPDTRGQIVALPLTRLAPYAQMISDLEEDGLLGAQDELWLGQDDRGRQAYISRYGNDNLAERAASVAREVKSSYRLAYQVVFQRGFVIAAREIYDARVGLAEHWGLGDPSGADVLLHWIELFNERVAPLLNDEDFWRGTAIAADGSLDYVQIPMHGVAGLVLLLTVHEWTSVYERPDDPREPGEEARGFERYLRRQPDADPFAGTEVHETDGDGDDDGFDAYPDSDRGLRLLDDDPYRSPDDDLGVLAAAAWGDLLNIRRGPAPGIVPALLRLATRWYRDSLRRYAGAVHQAAAGTDPDSDTVAEMVLALGARRLGGATRPTEDA
ncbi:DNA sulfur modification protein DndB [Nocardioides sp. YIM 152588]|uniref:DNA sulfur modification protein DndB n=1 Tax=Nocardioides sp. YIM 152588 TaxID=3158259 RepID=UPI0032E4F5FA